MSMHAESRRTNDCDENGFVEDEELFEKPRGNRRCQGKKHHRGKEILYNAVKDGTFIKKTINSVEPKSKNASQRAEKTTNDNLKINVVYSMNKKYRWRDANTMSLLGCVPEQLNAEIIERNVLEQYGSPYSNELIFAVHSRKINKEDAPGEFEIRSAKSSTAKGNPYSNFLPENRECSKRGSARVSKKDETVKGVPPTVSYNIYKPRGSLEIAVSEMLKTKTVSKSARHRANKKVDVEVYDDEDVLFEDEEEDTDPSEDSRSSQKFIDFTNHITMNQPKQNRHNNRKCNKPLFEAVSDPEEEYTQLLNVKQYLKREGYTFITACVSFSKITESFEHQISLLYEQSHLVIKDLRPNQFLVDISRCCHSSNDVKVGETTTILVFTHLKDATYEVVLNSTIISHPDKRSPMYLKERLSSSLSIVDAISRISADLVLYSRIIDSIHGSAKFYGDGSYSEQLDDAHAWNNQKLSIEWPSQYNHASWTNSEDLNTVGGRLEWNDLCQMVKNEDHIRTCYISDDTCGTCRQHYKSHCLFIVNNDAKIKCVNCLREEFYKEFTAKRWPIDLHTDTANELEYLPVFIPLTALNLYIRMVSETIYKDLGAIGDFEKCKSCKSTLFFENFNAQSTKSNQNRSCPCGYCWCRDCKDAPHWPMKCEEYSEWEKKWNLRYSIMHAQGSGTETLLHFTCFCGKAIVNILLPTTGFATCPACNLCVNFKTMNSMDEQLVYQRCKHNQYGMLLRFDGTPHDNFNTTYRKLSEIPQIKSSVIRICGVARDVRFDLKFRNHIVKRQKVLSQNIGLEEGNIVNLFGTVAYLVENVTAWMYMTNQYNRSVEKTLDQMMDNGKQLRELVEGSDKNAIVGCITTLREQIKHVVSFVENKLNNQ